MTPAALGWGLAALLLAAAAAYGLGRRRGIREGFVQGVHYAPLALRQVSLERGGCVLCGAQPDFVQELDTAAAGPYNQNQTLRAETS
ncbi:MAG TPA: hypothetical protein VKZ69_01210 [Limnochordales bacterium]|nr:hypothetical protein [Limnochordales bacterium]